MTASESREAAIRLFDRFLSHLGTIPDPRRAEGKLYQLPYVLLFSILAIVTGADSYRGIRTFIKTHLQRLVAVERKVLMFQPATGLWKSSFESSFYLSNRTVLAGQAAEAIRKHWGIE